MVKVDDAELAKIHALASAGDEPISMMLRRWVSERYAARFGDSPPPATTTKFGDTLNPHTKR